MAKFDFGNEEKNSAKRYEEITELKRVNNKSERRRFDEISTYKENPKTMNLSLLQNNLENCLSIIDEEVMKGYVTQIDKLPVVPVGDEVIDQLQNIHFFRISELVYQEHELAVDKLTTVFHTLSNKPCTLVLMIHSNGEINELFLGVRSLSPRFSTGTMKNMLQHSLEGLFPGSKIEGYYNEELKEDMRNISDYSISGVTCVADYRREQTSNEEYIQGLEKFIYSMQGKEYTAILIANNMTEDELAFVRKEYENIYTQISPFANMQLNFSVNDSESTADGKNVGMTKSYSHGSSEGMSYNVGKSSAHSEGTSDTIGETTTIGTTDTVSKGTTHTKGRSDGVTESTSDSKTDSVTKSSGVNINGGPAGTLAGAAGGAAIGLAVAGPVGAIIGGTVGAMAGGKIGGAVNVNNGKSKSSSSSHTDSHGTSHTDSVSDSISQTLSHGVSHSQAKSKTMGTTKSDTDTLSYGVGTQHGTSETEGDSYTFSASQTLTNAFGTSQGITLNSQNMTLISTLQKLEKQIERINMCESLGMWSFASYFLGESVADTETAANTYQAIISGMKTGIEKSAVNTWVDCEEQRMVAKYIKNFLHPLFLYPSFSYEGERNVIVDPAALINTEELAIHMGLPRHSVKGLPVVEHALFAQEIIARGKKSDHSINLGNIYHLGQKTNASVDLNMDSLTMHTFVTGSTGSGKSNTVYHMLDELRSKGTPFLVVEPAKGEYKKVFSDVRCYGTNSNMGEMLRVNPFSFPREVHVLEHIDRLVEIFNVCWPMYAAMPAVLKDAIESAYIAAGWDMELSRNVEYEGLFPTFEDVLTELRRVIRSSEYSADTQGDYIGALSTRLKSLTNGINGRIFVSDEVSMDNLFDHDAIVDISRIGSMETKALIMGIIVLKLQEYRMAEAKDMNVSLKHITVLEEAHNLLKKTSMEQSQDSANLTGKSVEMLTNTIAEIRTYGEGFIIVDQAPDLLDTAAIRNTNTKIVMRLPEGKDREITGLSMALNEHQIMELSKLPTGVAAVYQNDWQESVLCQMPQYKTGIAEKKTEFNRETNAQQSSNCAEEILHELLLDKLTSEEIEGISEKILKANLSSRIKKNLIRGIVKRDNSFDWALADFIKKKYRLDNMFQGTQRGCKTVQDMVDIVLSNMQENFKDFTEEEMLKILYYTCFVKREELPDNTSLPKLHDYVKGEVWKR